MKTNKAIEEGRKVKFYTAPSGYETTLMAKKTRRNDPCVCGSGLKAKNCCGTRTQYFVNPKKKEK